MTELKKHSSEEARLRFVINRAQTYKWTGDEEGCKKILSAEDWTATDLKFRLALAVLRDDFVGANELVSQIGAKDHSIDSHAYREWPLFKDFRKFPDFISLFEKIFGEPLNKFVVKADEAGDSGPKLPN